MTVVAGITVVLGCGAAPPIGAGAGGGQPTAPSQAPEVALFIIGDAGAPAPGFEPVLRALEAGLARAPERSVAVFLGDNIYPSGMPDSAAAQRAEAERRIDAQLAAIRNSGARAFFVPGNHDWDYSGTDGWNAILRLGRFVETHGGGRAVVAPANACPGPAVVDLGTTVRLVLVDTQWWFYDRRKPTSGEDGCAVATERGFLDSLRSSLGSTGDRRAVVLAHHPIRSGGRHGGYFGWKDHLFPLRAIHPALWIPLPVLGSVYPVARSLGIASQDLTSPEYGRLVDSLRAAFAGHPPLIYAGGHDHNLQVIEDQSVGYALVSGAGTLGHTSPAFKVADVLYASNKAGYMRVDFFPDGRVWLTVLTVDRHGAAAEDFTLPLR